MAETLQEESLYNVFTRTWWKRNPTWPNGLEPSMGHKTYREKGLTYADAIRTAKAYNDTHNPGKLSRKAEIEKCTK